MAKKILILSTDFGTERDEITVPLHKLREAGHEIVHVYAVESADLASLPSGDRLAVRDSHTTVGWYDLAALRRGGVSVYPVGVLDLLG